MTVARHIPEDELALFALALMQPEEAAFTVAHLKHCDLCRAEVARLQGDLVAYAMTADMQAAPSGARERLMRAVAQEKKFIPQPAVPVVAENMEPMPSARTVSPPERLSYYDDPPRRTMGFLNWGGWALAASLAALAGWQFHTNADLHRQMIDEAAALEQSSSPSSGDVERAREVLQTLTDPAALQVALRVPTPGHAPPKPEAHAAYVASTGKLIFVASHLHAIASNKTYELWLLPATGTSPMPAGLFRPDTNGNASVVLPPMPKYIVAKGFGVTVEDEAGSTRPTLPILLAGS